jgi:hypothetical protein
MTINNDPLGDFAGKIPSKPSDDWSVHELGRHSLEAFVKDREGTSRVLSSRGLIRLTGAGVRGNTVPLDELGSISQTWQKAVSATAAAVLSFKSHRGRLSSEILRKSQLLLESSPVAGSVVLNVVPQADPLEETEPEGIRQLIDESRPLADQAMQRLLAALSAVTESAESADTESIEGHLKELGPRVNSALSALAAIVERSGIVVEVSWAEPSRATLWSTMRPSEAKYLRRVIEGQKLDEEPLDIEAVVRTVSDTDSWRLDIIDGADNVQMSAADLSIEEVRDVRVNSTVRLRVFLSAKVLPTGETRNRYRIAEVLEIIEE